jgi:hypothetical protein
MVGLISLLIKNSVLKRIDDTSRGFPKNASHDPARPVCEERKRLISYSGASRWSRFWQPTVGFTWLAIEFQPVVRTVEPFALLDDYAADQRVALRIFAKRFEVEGTRGCALAKE